MMRRLRAPMALAAVTNSRWAKLSVAPRVTRANVGVATIATAMETLRRLWPSMAVMAITSTSAGKASITSTIPINNVSRRPR